MVHHPFVPFSILFTRVFQSLDVEDLERLERFATSLRAGQFPTKLPANFQRLYDLLCQAARLHLEANPPPHPTQDQVLLGHSVLSSNNSADLGILTNGCDLLDQNLEFVNAESNELSEWYFGNQQLVNLLDEDIII